MCPKEEEEERERTNDDDDDFDDSSRSRFFEEAGGDSKSGPLPNGGERRGRISIWDHLEEGNREP